MKRVLLIKKNPWIIEDLDEVSKISDNLEKLKT
jgi:hypothetical protein